MLLVGFMASGKTTVGRVLAGRLGWRFLDADLELEARTGRSIPAIFREDGEDAFRVVESGVTAELLKEDEVVVASGGGWPAVPGNWETVPEGTLSVWLDASLETVKERVGGDDVERPLLASEEGFGQARTLMERRESAYARAAVRLRVDGSTPEEIARQIQALVHDRGGTN